MRCYTNQHRFYAGVDLHARSLFTHVLDHQGKTVLEKDLAAQPEVFLDAVNPFRDGLVVGCECMFAWYWLADLCADHGSRRLGWGRGPDLEMRFGAARLDRDRHRRANHPGAA